MSTVSSLVKIPEDPTPIPTAPDTRTVFLGGIFIILLLAAIRYSSEIAIPIVLGFVLKLVLTPLLRFLQKLRLPRVASAIVIFALLISGITMLGSTLSEPAATWTDKVAGSLPKLRHQLGFVSDSIQEAQKVMTQAEDLTKGAGPKVMPVAVEGNRLSDRIFTGTRAFISGLFSTFLILFFLLVSGDTFLRRTVEILPRFKDKRQAVEISQQIERDISVYLLTITLINITVGVITGIIMVTCDVGDPLLWGTVAFLLNYIPVLGPILCTGVFIFAGLVTFPATLSALLPAGYYMLVHFIEGTLVTPLLLAKRFTLNPVLVILSVIFWYWMWGLAGAILAVPMLAITKIICDRIDKFKPIGHFLAG